MRTIKEHPFCIIRYNISAAGEEGKEWGLVTSPPKEGITVIDRDEAREIINEYKLVECLKNDDGIVYDTKDKAFYRKYKDFFKNRWKRKKDDNLV